MAGLLPADAAETVRKARRYSAAGYFLGLLAPAYQPVFLQPPDLAAEHCLPADNLCRNRYILWLCTDEDCNIWVAVIMHYLNNNLVAVIAGSADVISGQVIAWRDVLILLILNCILFVPFIFTKIYGKQEQSAGETKLQ